MGTNPVDDEGFIEWLRETLIPDLHESGQENLVADFERLIKIVEGKNTEFEGAVRALARLTNKKQWVVRRQNELTGGWEELTVISTDEGKRVITLESW